MAYYQVQMQASACHQLQYAPRNAIVASAASCDGLLKWHRHVNRCRHEVGLSKYGGQFEKVDGKWISTMPPFVRVDEEARGKEPPGSEWRQGESATPLEPLVEKYERSAEANPGASHPEEEEGEGQVC